MFIEDIGVFVKVLLRTAGEQLSTTGSLKAGNLNKIS